MKRIEATSPQAVKKQSPTVASPANEDLLSVRRSSIEISLGPTTANTNNFSPISHNRQANTFSSSSGRVRPCTARHVSSPKNRNVLPIKKVSLKPEKAQP